MIQQAGTLIPEARVTDSRGRWVTAQGGAVEVLSYANPTLTARLLGRCGADGTLRDDGDCVKVLWYRRMLTGRRAQHRDGAIPGCGR